MLYPVEKLIADHDSLLGVPENELVRNALAKMVEHDYSQLPIVDGSGNLSGIISEQSIARTYYHLDEKASVLDLSVTSCRDKPVTLTKDQDIFDALDGLRDSYAVVIVDGRRPVGILTNHDTTNFFRELSEGLIMVEDMEVILRKYIDDAFATDIEREEAMTNAFRHLMKGEDSASPDYDRLTFGDYISLITNSRNWVKFEGQLESRDVFRRYMDQVREIRNQLAHFRGQLDAIQRDVLKRALDWLDSRTRLEQPKTLPPLLAETPGAYVTSQSGKIYGSMARKSGQTNFEWL